MAPGASTRVAFTDQVVARGAHAAALRLHLAPGVAVRADGSSWLLVDGGSVVGRLSAHGFDFAEGRSPYHPSFGIEQERVCLEARLPFRDVLATTWTLDLGRDPKR